MVGHQHVGVNVAGAGECRFVQRMQVALIVRICQEAGLAIVSPLDDVLRKPKLKKPPPSEVKTSAKAMIDRLPTRGLT